MKGFGTGLGVALGLPVGLAVLWFTYQATQKLSEVAMGMLLGLVVATVLFAVTVMPFVFLQLRSREADKAEYMALAGKLGTGKAPSFDVSLSPQLVGGNSTGKDRQFTYLDDQDF